MRNERGYAYRRLREWTADRDQALVISEGAAAQFVVLEDPRLGAWDWDDTMTAVVCGRRTLPWLPEPGDRPRQIRRLDIVLRKRLMETAEAAMAWDAAGMS